jgi:hypothetical protein
VTDLKLGVEEELLDEVDGVQLFVGRAVRESAREAIAHDEAGLAGLLGLRDEIEQGLAQVHRRGRAVGVLDPQLRIDSLIARQHPRLCRQLRERADRTRTRPHTTAHTHTRTWAAGRVRETSEMGKRRAFWA